LRERKVHKAGVCLCDLCTVLLRGHSAGGSGVYVLQSRRQNLSDGKDYTQDAPWNEIQAILWEIINRAQPPEQLRGRFDEAALAEGSPPPTVGFQASATEQEIWHGALRVPDAHEHVLAFFRQIENVGEFSEPAQLKDFVDLDRPGE